VTTSTWPFHVKRLCDGANF
jgi:hypothetical protein